MAERALWSMPTLLDQLEQVKTTGKRSPSGKFSYVLCSKYGSLCHVSYVRFSESESLFLEGKTIELDLLMRAENSLIWTKQKSDPSYQSHIILDYMFVHLVSIPSLVFTTLGSTHNNLIWFFFPLQLCAVGWAMREWLLQSHSACFDAWKSQAHILLCTILTITLNWFSKGPEWPFMQKDFSFFSWHKTITEYN